MRTRRGTYTLFSKPGMARFGQPDHAATLLADEMTVKAGERVLVLHCGAGLPGLAVAAGAGAQVILADANIVAVEATQRAAVANGLADCITVMASGGTRELAGSPPCPPTLGGTLGRHGNAGRNVQDHGDDTAGHANPSLPQRLGVRGLTTIRTLLLPKGEAQRAADASGTLTRRSSPAVASTSPAPMPRAPRPTFATPKTLFGTIAVRGYRKGCRVGVAVKPDEPLPIPARFQEPWLDHGCFQPL